MKLIYTGDQGELNVPLKNGQLVTFPRGKAVEMPDEAIAAELITRDGWAVAEPTE